MFDSKIYKIAKKVERKLASSGSSLIKSSEKEDFVTEVNLENFKDYLLPKIKDELEKKWGKINLNEVELDLKDKAHIKWSIEFDMREWGVKSIYLYCPDQKIHVSGEAKDAEYEKTYDIEEDIEITDVEVTDPTKFSGQIAPETLSFFKGKFTLDF